jgi:hypothetical protein
MTSYDRICQVVRIPDETVVLERPQYRTRYRILYRIRSIIFSSQTGASVPRRPSIDSNEDREMDFDCHRDYMDQDIPARQFPTAQSGPIAQFLNGMSDWMNMTREDINLAVESLPNPSAWNITAGGHRGKVNECHHIHNRHYQIITLIVYTILYHKYQTQ